VVAALHDLEAEGWLVSEPNRGTFVAGRPPSAPLKGEGPHAGEPAGNPSPNFDIPSRLSPLSVQDPEALVLSDGLPDPGLFPAAELAKAYQRALQRHSRELLQYGEPMGNSLLRAALADWLRERRALPVSPDQILITRGSRMALTLLSLGLLREGAVVAVENPGNRQAWETILQCTKVQLRPLPVDQEGLIVEALEELLEREPVAALYVTPQRQYPTAARLSQERRKRLLELAAAHRIAVIEEDQESEYAFESTSEAALASLDTTGQVIHMASLSRLMAPGLRLGFLVAPRDLVDRLARLQRSLEWQGDRVLEWAVADLIRDGILARHLRKARKIYQERRDCLVELLAPHRRDRLQFEVPTGGLALWVRAAEKVDLGAWIQAARPLGLVLHDPSHFEFQGAGLGTRIGFAQVDESRLREAVRRLDLAWERRTAKG
ncbi:MAG TPA: PLP-dependent aminotransferase family protein, partial [Holophagaceae bacterium]|nr:PLP-dependent aminotransferase family protein [Holophagaceae bacterium]